MRTNNYYIKITFAKRSTLVKEIDNVPYKNSGIFGDSFSFQHKEITIVASRSSIYDKTKILSNTSNSIYQQISKALLYCYAVNLSSLQLRSINIVRKTARKEEKVVNLLYNKKDQPLQGTITSHVSFNPDDLVTLLKEDYKAEKLKNTLSHWLKGMSSTDRYYKFERLWRTFEQLSFYRNKSLDNKEFNALRTMRSFVIEHPQYFTNTGNLLSAMTFEDLRKFHWRELILNNYPRGGTKGVYEGYKEYFVIANTDYRIIYLLEETLAYRDAELDKYGFLKDIKEHISSYKLHPQTNNMQLAALLCCKYAYFLRNKMFHGEVVDKTFRFIPYNNDDILIDKINKLLEEITSELLSTYNNL